MKNFNVKSCTEKGYRWVVRGKVGTCRTGTSTMSGQTTLSGTVDLKGATVIGSNFGDASVSTAKLASKAVTTDKIAFDGGALSGFRNRIINGAFIINQRGYVSGSNIAAGTYAHDRWKAGASGCAYVFTQNKADTTITIASGSLMQIIEDANIEGGNFVLSWAGSAQARINGGSYSSRAYREVCVRAATRDNG